jgi:4,5-dihydroxyphthalate decarboxylase
MNLPSKIDVREIAPGQTHPRMARLAHCTERTEPSTFLSDPDRVVRLFPDYVGAEKAYFARTGIFPITHVIVIRDDVLAANQWVARSLMKAFEEARDLTYHDLAETTTLPVSLPWLMSAYEEAVEVFGTEDFWSYGRDDNREVLDTFLRYSFEQGLSARKLEVDELFAPSTLSTSKI